MAASWPKWSVVASGPSGLDVPDCALLHSKVIVVNSAINRVNWDRVDYYLFRHPSVNDNKDLTPLLEKGIWLISVPAWIEAPDWRSAVEFIDCRDEFIKERGAKEITWKRGTYSPFTDPIGPQALQYAVNHGAEEVHCWGLEGGPFECVELKPASGQVSPVSSAPVTNVGLTTYHRRIVHAVVRACPEVRFTFHGQLMYPMDFPNVELAA